MKTRPLNEAENANFATLLRAAQDGALGLMSALDRETGEHRALIVALSRDHEGEYHITPFGHLAPGNPYEDYVSPLEADPEIINGEA